MHTEVLYYGKTQNISLQAGCIFLPDNYENHSQTRHVLLAPHVLHRVQSFTRKALDRCDRPTLQLAQRQLTVWQGRRHKTCPRDYDTESVFNTAAQLARYPTSNRLGSLCATPSVSKLHRRVTQSSKAQPAFMRLEGTWGG